MNRIQEASWRLALSEGSPIARRRVTSRDGARIQPSLARLLAALRRKRTN